MTPDEVVKRVFGHPGFRTGQRAAIDALLGGRDVQVLLPTGGGKSLCFQVPAVVMAAQGRGPMLVVSPLIALMEDQVAALKAGGVDARMLHSGIPWDEQKKTLAEAGGAALIYCSPERLGVKRFRVWLAKVGISAVAIDEAHCISEWGHDFRKDYRKLDVLKSTFDVPIIALTATATRRVLDEISDALRLEEPLHVSGAFERENLRFTVEHHTGDKARVARCVEILAELGVGKKPVAGRAVVYASTRKKVVAVAKALKAHKLKVGWYHAGRTAGARAKAQSDFESGKHLVLVATTAFGMGIDHADVRLVCHVQAPGSLEAYYQQAGRAGRDGEPAECVLLYGPGDSVTQARLRGKTSSAGAEAGWKGLQDYVFGQGCREQALVHWFLGACGAPCGRCDACVCPEEVGQAVTGARQQLKDRAAARTK
ncbi:MAG: RecQ family ATP-dependent DNA helicase, partial [Rhodobacterales bacterium]|nr:RecQ family ATP-dependent DNA helicase [Rhodobacterales bacterium]